jgi:hypothetical protein
MDKYFVEVGFVQNSAMESTAQANAGSMNHEKIVNRGITLPLLEQIKAG